MKHALLSIPLASLLLATPDTHAQTNPCGSGIPSQQWESQFQELMKNTRNNATGKTESVAYTIPVIIHVVHGGQAAGTYPNLAQAQLNSQIQVLNNDYAGAGLNSGNYPLQAYTNYVLAQGLPSTDLDNLGRVKIANCNVQFCLAKKDTLGNTLPEPGIDRIDYTTKGWTNPATFTLLSTFQNYITNTIKPQSIWNTTKYLNLWVTDENINAAGIGGLLGFATFPPLSTLTGMISSSTGTHNTDGVWCYAKAFGSANYYAGGSYYSTGYNKGRTATHEIGHWLGLRHIWGDANCATDYCDDTPTAAASNAGTPNYPYHVGTCSDNLQDGEMYMNFMDYTNDNGKYMFTPDQADRMLTSLINSPYRNQMGTHGLCVVNEVAASSTFSMNASACAGTRLALNNTSAGTPVPSYTWTGTGGVTFTPNISVTSPSITFPSAGIYTITLTSNNGTVSTTSETITVNPLPNLVFSAPSNMTVCNNDPVTITASGASFYSWAPGSVVSASLSFVAVAGAPVTLTCSATDSNGCKAKGVISVIATECTGIAEQSATGAMVHVFPNPATNQVTLKADKPVTDLVIEITDMTGKTMLRQNLTFTRDKQDVQLNIAHLANGVYTLKLQSKDYNQVMKLVKSN